MNSAKSCGCTHTHTHTHTHVYSLKSKIIIITILMILVSGVSVYATYKYFANEVVYTKADGTEISVEEALNELYSNTFSKMTYYTSITAGKNQDSNNNSVVTYNFTLPKGNYIIFAVRSAANWSSAGYGRNDIGNYFSLTGCDSVKILNYEYLGMYKNNSDYVNQFTNVYYCKVENQRNLTGSHNTGGDDSTILLEVFKLER